MGEIPIRPLTAQQMPTIKRIARKPDSRKKTGRNKVYFDLLNTRRWRNLRAAYLAEHPLCEDCIEAGRTTPAEEVHHVEEILSGEDYEEMAALAYDPANLRALCADCHHARHGKINRKVQL